MWFLRLPSTERSFGIIELYPSSVELKNETKFFIQSGDSGSDLSKLDSLALRSKDNANVLSSGSLSFFISFSFKRECEGEHSRSFLSFFPVCVSVCVSLFVRVCVSVCVSLSFFECSQTVDAWLITPFFCVSLFVRVCVSVCVSLFVSMHWYFS